MNLESVIKILELFQAQLAGIAEYTDWITAKG